MEICHCSIIVIGWSLGEEDTTDIKNDDVEDVENNYKEDIENYDVEDVVNDMEDVMNNTEDVKNNEMEKKWKVLISEFVEEIKELKSLL